jgi:hypothetical protein
MARSTLLQEILSQAALSGKTIEVGRKQPELTVIGPNGINLQNVLYVKGTVNSYDEDEHYQSIPNTFYRTFTIDVDIDSNASDQGLVFKESEGDTDYTIPGDVTDLAGETGTYTVTVRGVGIDEVYDDMTIS